MQLKEGNTLRPMLFTPDMLAAILALRKTETRRVMKVQPGGIVTKCWNVEGNTWAMYVMEKSNARTLIIKCPYGVAGDILAVREAWRLTKNGDYRYKSDLSFPGEAGMWSWKSPLFMPYKAARYFLEILDTHPERIQSIEEGGIETCPPCPEGTYCAAATNDPSNNPSDNQNARSHHNGNTNPGDQTSLGIG